MKGNKKTIHHLKLAGKIIFQPLILKGNLGPRTEQDDYRNRNQEGLNTITPEKNSYNYSIET